jgi:hypothetical protein
VRISRDRGNQVVTGSPLYRLLVPDAPLHRHTEVDEPRGPQFGPRAAAVREVVPGLESPSLVSSFDGAIDRILFCFPAWAASDLRLVRGYVSVIEALRVGTRFVVVHNESVRSVVEEWFADAGHPADNVDFVPLPDYVAVTDWAEDAYVSLRDAADGADYLMEPWSFGRAGDALIADAVEEYTDIRASGSPLIFQGGNCLVGSDFWLLGTDYFADTVALLTDSRPPISIPHDTTAGAFAVELFTRYVEGERKLILVGTKKPIALREYVGTREGNHYYLDIPAGGTGTFQPIFHIDMFGTLVGPNAEGAFEVLVGSPTMADELLGTSSPFGLAEVYDGIGRDLERSGFVVRRNPLVHRPSPGRTIGFNELKQLSKDPDNAVLVPAVAELAAAGAMDTTTVRVRDWYHITWNNCLVENSTTAGKHVYLPTFGYGDDVDLAVVDSFMKTLWEELGFTVHLLGDFSQFARRQGVVHCIKKYLKRGG